MDIKAEKIKPYVTDNRAKGQQVKDMFDNIAPAYDFMNRAMTLGIDKSWRKKAVNIMMAHKNESSTNLSTPYKILDVATGTADLAISLAKKMPDAKITGVDLSDGMIEIGRKKVNDMGLADNITLQIADCLDLPFDDNTFSCICVAFGVRNFEHLLDGYSEMLRVLKPGGMLCVLELSVPRSKIIKPFYHLYTRHVIPIAGRIASKDVRAYSYLPASIEAVPQRESMTNLILESGFSRADFKTLTFGVCTLYTATK